MGRARVPRGAGTCGVPSSSGRAFPSAQEYLMKSSDSRALRRAGVRPRCCPRRCARWHRTRPGTAIVSIYQVAPGKHRAFLKWMAAREAVGRGSRRAGDQVVSPPGWRQLGLHRHRARPRRGDRRTRPMRSRSNAAWPSAMRSGLELRELMASHTDTIRRRPDDGGRDGGGSRQALSRHRLRPAPQAPDVDALSDPGDFAITEACRRIVVAPCPVGVHPPKKAPR